MKDTPLLIFLLLALIKDNITLKYNRYRPESRKSFEETTASRLVRNEKIEFSSVLDSPSMSYHRGHVENVDQDRTFCIQSGSCDRKWGNFQRLPLPKQFHVRCIFIYPHLIQSIQITAMITSSKTCPPIIHENIR